MPGAPSIAGTFLHEMDGDFAVSQESFSASLRRA